MPVKITKNKPDSYNKGKVTVILKNKGNTPTREIGTKKIYIRHK